jgi:hypothetical protein
VNPFDAAVHWNCAVWEPIKQQTGLGVSRSSLQQREEQTGMKDLESVRKFEYRPCRIETGFNVEFMSGQQRFHGQCRDVSNAGIRAKLDGQVVVGSSGTLTLHHPRSVLELEARVIYIDKEHAGFAFKFQSPLEVEMTTAYIAAIVNLKATPLIVRFS